MLARNLKPVRDKTNEIKRNNQVSITVDETPNFVRYLKIYIISVIVLVTPLISNYFFIRNAGELLPVQKIYEIMDKSEPYRIIYGSALFNDVGLLKLFAFESKKPEIITLGSSRVLQFRESFFSKPFYNLGMVSSVHKALETARSILTVHTPDVVIMGVDFWWFNENYQKPDYDLNPTRNSNAVEPAHIMLPFKWLKNGTISLKDYFAYFNFNSLPHIGIRGKLKQAGFAADGSYYYTDIIVGESPYSEKRDLKEVNAAIKEHQRRFQPGSHASDIHFQKFLELIKLFQEKNVKLIIFLPPLSPELNNTMKDYDYSYIEDLKEKLKKAGTTVYDFTRPDQIFHTNECEFIDQTHGGDVLYAKILFYLSLKEPILDNYIRKNELNDIQKKYSGLAMIPDPRVTSKSEIDFLNKGCRKQNLSDPKHNKFDKDLTA